MTGGFSMPHNEMILITVFVMIGSLALILIVMFIVRRAKEASSMTNENEIGFSLAEQSFKCPKCQLDMLSGFTYAARGLFWRGIQEKAPSLFSPVGTSISNTLIWGFKPRGNLAWRCVHCNLLLIDHSSLMSQAKPRTAG